MSFDCSKLKITLNPNCPEPLPHDKLIFGNTYTPHMAKVSWTRTGGWETPEIVPFGPIAMHPGCSVLHYGLEIFEGQKAYAAADGRKLMFRPIENATRMSRSAARLCLPTFEPKDLVELVDKLVAIDARYIPEGEGMSMYIRPTMISMDERLGVKPADKAMLYVILSPSGKYFSSAAPMIYATSKYARAVPGGVGDCKCGGNYAPTIYPQTIAQQAGCPQVLWLTPDEHKYVTEVGAMNFFMCFKPTTPGGKTRLVTAPLDGLILPGITRKSVIELVQARFPEYEIAEEQVTMDYLAKAIKSGDCVELFGCGTAAVITQVAGINYDGEELRCGPAHPIAEKLYKALVDIQTGRDTYKDWTYEIKM